DAVFVNVKFGTAPGLRDQSVIQIAQEKFQRLGLGKVREFNGNALVDIRIDIHLPARHGRQAAKKLSQGPVIKRRIGGFITPAPDEVIRRLSERRYDTPERDR